MLKTSQFIKKSSFVILCSSFLTLAACSSDSENGESYKGFGGGSQIGGGSSGQSGGQQGGAQSGNPSSSVGVTAFIVTGKVVEQNGNPVANAAVNIAGQSVSTDANGVYSVSDVPLNNLEPIAISVGSNNHVDFSYTVSPTNSNTFVAETGTSCNSFNNQGGDLQSLISASASTYATVCSREVATLTANDNLTVNVKRFDGANEPVANAVAKLEWQGSASIPADNGVTYITAPMTVQTNNSGLLSVTNLPAASYFTVSFNDYAVEQVQPLQLLPEGGAANISTTATDVYVKQQQQDTQAPKVSELNGVLTVSGSVAQLNKTVDGSTSPLVIQFDEVLDASKFIVADVTLTDSNSSPVSFNASLNETANALLVTTNNALFSGESYKLSLDRFSFQDESGNIIEAAGLPYVSLSDNAGRLIIEFQAFDSTATAPNPNTVVLSQALEQSPGESDYPLTYRINKVIKDVSSFAGVQQLNSTDDDDKFNGNDTGERLLALAKAFIESATDDTELQGALTPSEFLVDQARVNFNYAKGIDLPRFAVALNDAAGQPSVINIVAEDLPEGVTVENNNSQQAELVIADTFDGAIGLTLSSVAAGFEVVVTPMNSTGELLTANQGSYLLEDLIPPTTVVQRSYGQGLQSTQYVTPNLGAGGELVDTTAPIGPYLNVTPWLLAQTQPGGLQVTNADTVWQDLSAAIARDPMTNKALVDVTFPNQDCDCPGEKGFVGYDIPAVTAWLASLGPRNIAVAFSENVTLTGVPSLTGVSTALSNWGAYNNVYQTVLGDLVNEDLITVEVADVFSFANNDHGGVIDFAGVVTDSQGNVATSDENPKVIVRDLMPPIAVNAELVANDELRCNGSVYCMVIDFNEPVTLQPNDQFTLFSSMKSGAIQSETLTFADKNANNNIATSTLILDLTRYQEANDGLLSIDDYRLNYKELFDRGEIYDADGFSLNPTTMLSFADVRDVNGNSWNNWYEGDAPPIKTPAITMTRSSVPAFGFSLTASSIAAGSSTVTLEYTASHAFHFENVGSGFDAAAAFEIERANPASPAIAIQPTSAAYLSDKGRVVTIIIETDEPFETGDIIKGATFESAWNSSILITAADISVP